MKKPKQTKTGIDITNAPASELRKLPGFTPALVREIIAVRRNIIVRLGFIDPTTSKQITLGFSQEEDAAVQAVAKECGCPSVTDLTLLIIDEARNENARRDGTIIDFGVVSEANL